MANKATLKYILVFVLIHILKPISFLVYGKKNIWLLSEKGDFAQDNDYYFLKYLVAKKINTYYLLHKNSSDYKYVKEISKVIEYGSFRNLLLLLSANVLASTHMYGYCKWYSVEQYFRRHKNNQVHVFLQHGITKDNIPILYGDNNIDVFVCGAKREYEYINTFFRYRENVVQLIGFPRFDDLHDYKKKNIILVMPTWRKYLNNISQEDFHNSDFFNKWHTLLSNAHILNYIKQNNIEIQLYLHRSFMRYSHFFKDLSSVNVIDYDMRVHDLLKNCSFLITDYSSVFFDVAYMEKPLVYFQFDKTMYRKGHYSEGYFDYDADGFGPVFVDECNLVQYIIKNFKNYCPEDVYLKRSNAFFGKKDNHNCERLYNRIISVLGNQKCLMKKEIL